MRKFIRRKTQARHVAGEQLQLKDVVVRAGQALPPLTRPFTAP